MIWLDHPTDQDQRGLAEIGGMRVHVQREGHFVKRRITERLCYILMPPVQYFARMGRASGSAEGDVGALRPHLRRLLAILQHARTLSILSPNRGAPAAVAQASTAVRKSVRRKEAEPGAKGAGIGRTQRKESAYSPASSSRGTST